ncbi:MAG TPA: CapA family protein, partial [Chitinophagales bacterium]|nr:CapA family protein [Chitinophagales bacterium]
YVWGNVLPVMKKTDFNLINLETTLTRSVKQVSKTFNFKALPDRVECLTLANISVVNLANNHILDYTEEGLLETIATLKHQHIEYTGAGYNSADAEKAVRLTCKEISLGILGLTDNEPGWKAGRHHPGTNYVDIDNAHDRDAALTAIQNLKREVNCCIVSIHWGPNMRIKPSKKFIAFAHAMIEHGADIIHGHSAHIFQGIEIYRDKLILYDTGDFVDDYSVDPLLRNDRSFFFICSITKEGIRSLQLVPVLIDNFQVNLAAGEDYQWCIHRMQQLSKEFGTEVSNSGEVVFRNRLESEKPASVIE